MLYKGLKIGVFYNDKSWAEKWMNDFIDSIDHSYVLRFVKNGIYPFMIELKDGTKIIACQINDNMKKVDVDKAFFEI